MNNDEKIKEVLKEEEKIIEMEKKEEKNIKNIMETVTNNNKNKANYVLSASILIAAVLISGALIYGKGLGVTEQKANVGSTVNSGATANDDAFVVKKDDLVFGKDNAPVTIFLYSDPSCPFCAAADGGNQEVINYLKSNSPSWTAPIPGIMENYVNTGKARLIYRYYPGHGTGEEAMNVLYCAYDQGKFWELHKAIADNQSDVADIAKVKNLASGVGIDISKLDTCLNSGKYKGKTTADTDLGTKAGVNGTPGFFINKISKAGAQPFSEFKKLIDTILNAQ